jgi:hypothetical protein
MVAIFTGSEIGWSGYSSPVSPPYCPQEEYEKMEGREFIFRWDEEKQLILMLCDNVYCIHRRSIPEESIMEANNCTNCSICYEIFDDLSYFKVPSKMMDIIIKQTMLRKDITRKMPDEKKKCFKYSEMTTSVW